MKELLCINANYSAVLADNGKTGPALLPQVEVILILSEPAYEIDPAGGVYKHREIEQFRFLASVKNLRKAAAELSKLADECEELIGKFEAKKQP